MEPDPLAGTSSAYRHWDRTWRTPSGQSSWGSHDGWVADTVRLLRRRRVNRVLDLGCGIGRHATFLALQGFTCHGLDRSAAGVAHARRVAGHAGATVEFTVGDMTRLPYPSGIFGYVLAFNVVYHGDAATVAQAIAEIRRVLVDGGLYQTTMLSTRNAAFRRGVEVGPGTWSQPDVADDKVHPHFYCDAQQLLALHQGLRLMSAFDAEQGGEGSFHWHCLFEAPADSPVPTP